MENQIKSTIEFQLYELDNQYKNNTNLINYIEEAENFYNGNQYPNSNYNNMIRVTMNICSFSANIKASKICGTPIYLTFTSDNPDIDCTKLRQFDEYVTNKMGLKESNFQAAKNGYVDGTEITFVRWDDDDTSYKGIYKGGLTEEHIDIRNWAVANPYIQSIQNQEWVMYWDDVPVKVLHEMLEGTDEEIEEKKEFIQREFYNNDGYKYESDINHALCRMYVRFFRIDGEVYFNCATKYCNVFKYPHALSPRVNESKIKKIVDEFKKNQDKQEFDESGNIVEDYEIDYEKIVIPSTDKDEFTDEEYAEENDKFSLYPFARYEPFPQNRSFYGRSDIKQMIPIQKGINFAYSMMLKCAENNAYNKIIVKPEALKGQKITNEPSQVLTDYSGFTNGWGIKFAESQPMPNGLIDFNDRLLSTTRVIYGFNDVMDGSVTNQDMSGYMLQQMIKQSNTSIEQQQQLFFRYNVEKAAIRLMYYKHYVDKAKYTYELDDATYDAEEQARKMLYNASLNGKRFETMPNATPQDFANPTRRTRVETMDANALYGSNFDISIEAMQGLQDSKLIEQQMWDELFKTGAINNIDPQLLEMYFEFAPNISPRTKTSMKKAVENMKQSKIAMLENRIQDITQKAQQLLGYAQQLEAKLGYQGEYVKNLESEFTNKINQQNKINSALLNDLQKQQAKGQKDEQRAAQTTQVATGGIQ